MIYYNFPQRGSLFVHVLYCSDVLVSFDALAPHVYVLLGMPCCFLPAFIHLAPIRKETPVLITIDISAREAKPLQDGLSDLP